jgi:hypothetical protein
LRSRCWVFGSPHWRPSRQLDAARIDALVEQLYDINKRLVG